MRLITILARTLLGIDSSVIPRQLLQSLHVPFLGILIITPSFQSSGISFLFHAVVNNGSKISAANGGSDLKSSAFRKSGPGALLFLRDLMALMISSFVGGVVATSRSFSASWISGSVSGAGRFRTSLKCSVHLASCAVSDVSSWPSLFLIGAVVILLSFPHTCFVIL